MYGWTNGQPEDNNKNWSNGGGGIEIVFVLLTVYIHIISILYRTVDHCLTNTFP